MQIIIRVTLGCISIDNVLQCINVCGPCPLGVSSRGPLAILWCIDNRQGHLCMSGALCECQCLFFVFFTASSQFHRRGFSFVLSCILSAVNDSMLVDDLCGSDCHLGGVWDAYFVLWHSNVGFLKAISFRFLLTIIDCNCN